MFSIDKKRDLNLGGKSKQLDRKEMIEAARKERQQRENFIKETKAATLIQSIYRNYKRIKISRKLYLGIFHDLLKTLFAQKVDLESKENVNHLNRLVLIFCFLHASAKFQGTCLEFNPVLPESELLEKHSLLVISLLSKIRIRFSKFLASSLLSILCLSNILLHETQCEVICQIVESDHTLSKFLMILWAKSCVSNLSSANSCRSILAAFSKRLNVFGDNFIKYMLNLPNLKKILVDFNFKFILSSFSSNIFYVELSLTARVNILDMLMEVDPIQFVELLGFVMFPGQELLNHEFFQSSKFLNLLNLCRPASHCINSLFVAVSDSYWLNLWRFDSEVSLDTLYFLLDYCTSSFPSNSKALIIPESIFPILFIVLSNFEKYLGISNLPLDIMVKLVTLNRNLLYQFYWNNSIFIELAPESRYYTLPSNMNVQKLSLAEEDDEKNSSSVLVWYKIVSSNRNIITSLHKDVVEMIRIKSVSLMHVLHNVCSVSDVYPTDVSFLSSFYPLANPLPLAVFTSSLYSNSDPEADTAARRIISTFPYMVHFNMRLEYFNMCIEREKQINNFVRISIRRSHVLEDGLKFLSGIQLKSTKVQITFISADGTEEAGIDGGGLWKEFLMLLVNEICADSQQIMQCTEMHTLIPAYDSSKDKAFNQKRISMYTLLGRLIGVSLLQGVLLPVRFSPAFLSTMCNRELSLETLKFVDEQVYFNMKKLLKASAAELVQWQLTFSVTISNQTIELCPRGSDRYVTMDNRSEFVALFLENRIQRVFKYASEAVREGVAEVVPLFMLAPFTASELEIVISGSNFISVLDWREYSTYNIFNADENCINWFWEAVEEMDDLLRQKLLLFVTACSRAPLLGFKALRPPFCISLSNNDHTALPTASTCFNLFKMPRYTSKLELVEKVTLAITSGAGFDMS